MVLATPGTECAELLRAMRVRILCLLLYQICLIALHSFNLFAVPGITARLINQQYDGEANCSTSVAHNDVSGYHACICSEVKLFHFHTALILIR